MHNIDKSIVLDSEWSEKSMGFTMKCGLFLLYKYKK